MRTILEMNKEELVELNLDNIDIPFNREEMKKFYNKMNIQELKEAFTSFGN